MASPEATPSVDPALGAYTVTTQDFAYVVPLEKFVYRSRGAWNTEPVGREGIKHHLLEGGWSAGNVAEFLKNHDYLRAYGFDLLPNKPAMAKDTDQRLWLNTWVKPSIEPSPGPWPTIGAVLDHLTAGDPTGRVWLEHWISAKLQSPAFVPKVAVVLTTEQCGGKGLLAFVIRTLLGWANTAQIKRSELENKFNARWAGKLFILADEILNSDNMRNISDLLKILVDGNEVEVESKGQNQRVVANRAAWLFASNDRIDPVQVERSDRRYTVFANHTPTPPAYKLSLDALFCADRITPTAAFKAEMAGFADYCMHLTVDRGLIAKPHVNTSRTDLIEASASAHDLYFEAVDNGEVDGLIDYVTTHTDHYLAATPSEWDFGVEGVAVHVLYRTYVEYCRRMGARPLKSNRFGIVTKRHGWPAARQAVGNKRVQAYVVPRRPKPKAKEAA